HIVVELATGRLEQLIESPAHGHDRRPGIDMPPCNLDLAQLPPHHRALFEQLDWRPGGRDRNGGGQPTNPSADDDDRSILCYSAPRAHATHAWIHGSNAEISPPGPRVGP